MHVAVRTPIKPPEPTFAELFTPKLVTYCVPATPQRLQSRCDRWADSRHRRPAVVHGHRHRSGLSPEQGLFTAIVGGFLISALGGSRFQIGGPAGAFIVLVASTVERQGFDGLRARDDPGRRVAGGGRLSAARHLHQVHSLSGHRRLHRRHRRHHLRKPDQAIFSGSTLDASSRRRSLAKLGASGSASPRFNPATVALRR